MSTTFTFAGVVQLGVSQPLQVLVSKPKARKAASVGRAGQVKLMVKVLPSNRVRIIENIENIRNIEKYQRYCNCINVGPSVLESNRIGRSV